MGVQSYLLSFGVNFGCLGSWGTAGLVHGDPLPNKKNKPTDIHHRIFQPRLGIFTKT